MSDDTDNKKTPGKISAKALLSVLGGSGTLTAIITFAVQAYNDAQDKWEERYQNDRAALHSKLDEHKAGLKEHKEDLEKQVKALKDKLEKKETEINALNAAFITAAAKVQGDQAQWKQIKKNEEEIDRIKYERRLEKELKEMTRKKENELEKDKEHFMEKWMKLYRDKILNDGAHLNPAPAPVPAPAPAHKPHAPTSLTDKEYIEHKIGTLHDE